MKFLWVVIVIILLLVLLCVIPAKIIYRPSRYSSPLILEKDVKRVPYQTDQGSQTAYYVQNGDPQDHVWVLFSGNGSLALHWMSLVRKLPGAFLLFDYPGYGECKGTCSPEAIQDAAKRACAALEEQTGPVQWNVLGHSLGAAAALAFAAEHPVDKVVAIAPFTSIRDMARRFVGPLCHFPHRHHFDNRQRLSEIRKKPDVPEVHIFHGSRDSLVPVTMGRQLYDEFYDMVTYHEVPGANHNDVLDRISLKRIMSKTSLKST